MSQSALSSPNTDFDWIDRCVPAFVVSCEFCVVLLGSHFEPNLARSTAVRQFRPSAAVWCAIVRSASERGYRARRQGAGGGRWSACPETKEVAMLWRFEIQVGAPVFLCVLSIVALCGPTLLAAG